MTDFALPADLAYNRGLMQAGAEWLRTSLKTLRGETGDRPTAHPQH